MKVGGGGEACGNVVVVEVMGKVHSVGESGNVGVGRDGSGGGVRSNWCSEE